MRVYAPQTSQNAGPARRASALLAALCACALVCAALAAPTPARAAWYDDALASALGFLGLGDSSGSSASQAQSSSESVWPDATASTQDQASGEQASAADTSDSSSASAAPADGTVREEVVAQIEERIRAAVIACQTTPVDIEDLNASEEEYLQAWEQAEVGYEAQMMHWQGGSHVSVMGTNRHVKSFTLTYQVDDDTLPTYTQQLNDLVQQIAAQVDPSESNYAKAVFAHDWLVNNVTYDSAHDQGEAGNGFWHTPLSALRDHSAVCSGYAAAYELLLEAMGIECRVIRSHAMNHDWNAVLLDGSWYYVDVTWDDADSDAPAGRLYFMVSTASISRDHYDWTNAVDAPADLYLPDARRCDPNETSLADAFLQAAYDGYTGMVDVFSYGISSDDFSALTSSLDEQGYFWGMSQFQWWWKSNDEGVVTFFRLGF